jgi:hypothetical protein
MPVGDRGPSHSGPLKRVGRKYLFIGVFVPREDRDHLGCLPGWMLATRS